MAEQEEARDENENLRKAYTKRMRAMQMEQQRRELAKRFVTPEAYERLMNVRLANYELYEQLLNLIIGMVQSNRIASKLTEAQLKGILAKLTYRPETNIEFKHK